MRRAKSVHPPEKSTKSNETSRKAAADASLRIVNNIPPDLPIFELELNIVEAYLNEVIVDLAEMQDRNKIK